MYTWQKRFLSFQKDWVALWRQDSKVGSRGLLPWIRKSCQGGQTYDCQGRSLYVVQKKVQLGENKTTSNYDLVSFVILLLIIVTSSTKGRKLFSTVIKSPQSKQLLACCPTNNPSLHLHGMGCLVGPRGHCPLVISWGRQQVINWQVTLSQSLTKLPDNKRAGQTFTVSGIANSFNQVGHTVTVSGIATS